MIELKDVSFTYGETAHTVLKHINLSIEPGSFILLTGESGCGKTTLTRVLNGLCPDFYPGTLTGTYWLNGRDTASIPVSEMGTLIGSVFQDPRSQFFTTNTLDEMVLGMENHATDREQMQRQLKETCALIGVEALIGRSIFPLSSGEKQRIGIASVHAMQPEILVLDEPSANLDSDGIARLTVLLSRLKEKGTTIILSEHRLHYAKELFDRMVYMKDGAIAAIYERKEALSLSNQELEARGLRLFEEPQLQADRTVTGQAVLIGEQISFSGNGKKILSDVSITAEAGRVLAITGKNGAGKSTLCRILTGLQKPHVGQISINGQVKKRKPRIRSTFFVQQDADYQLYAASVEEEFQVARRRSEDRTQEIAALLEEVGLAAHAKRHPISLSGGQKQRLLLALAAFSGKEILVFDEPTSGLDGANMRMTAKLLRRLAKQGKCIILITHDVELLVRAADSIFYMEDGEMVYHRRIIRNRQME